MTEAIGAATTIKPRIPAYKKEGNYAPPSPALLNGSVASSSDPAIPIAIRSIEESARPGPAGTSDALVGAVNKIFQAVTAQIAYHEREAAKLRESLKPFAGLAPRPNVAPDDGSSAQAIRAVLDLADQLNLNGEQKP
jgi:hypothetical protein